MEGAEFIMTTVYHPVMDASSRITHHLTDLSPAEHHVHITDVQQPSEGSQHFVQSEPTWYLMKWPQVLCLY